MTPRPRHIVLIVCHDLGQHLGCYGVPTVQTPVIDGLASQGARFSNSFCVAPQCSPSRSTLYTGRYPHANGVMGLAHPGFAWEYHPTERHLSNLLGDAGWRCVLAGGMHETRDPAVMEYEKIVMGQVRECTKVAQDAAGVIYEHQDDPRSLYLQIGFMEPHRPFDAFGTEPDDELGVTVPDYLVDEPRAREEFAGFQGSVRKLDGAIQTIVDALADTGLAEDTMLIFTTDHGIPFPRAKCSVYDAGLQVCLVMRWPGAPWQSGLVFDEVISNVDYVPTLLDMLGLESPSNLQGRSFLGLLNGSGYEPREEIFAEMTYHDSYDPIRTIRTATHKLIVNFSPATSFMDPTQSWRPKTVTKHPEDPANSHHPMVELYDLVADPLEWENLADRSEHAGIQQSLLSRLHSWMVDTDDPLLEGPPPSPRHIAAVDVLRKA